MFSIRGADSKPIGTLYLFLTGVHYTVHNFALRWTEMSSDAITGGMGLPTSGGAS